MKEHPDDCYLQGRGCFAICRFLERSPANGDKVGAGAIQVIVEAMKSNPYSCQSVRFHGCNALFYLASGNNEHREEIIKADGWAAISYIINYFRDDQEISEAAAKLERILFPGLQEDNDG